MCLRESMDEPSIYVCLCLSVQGRTFIFTCAYM